MFIQMIYYLIYDYNYYEKFLLIKYNDIEYIDKIKI